jgi:hypothetical protein
MGQAIPVEKCPKGGNHSPSHNGSTVVCDKCGKVLKEG